MYPTSSKRMTVLDMRLNKLIVEVETVMDVFHHCFGSHSLKAAELHW